MTDIAYFLAMVSLVVVMAVLGRSLLVIAALVATALVYQVAVVMLCARYLPTTRIWWSTVCP